MLEPEIADLRDILLAMPVTNSEGQATRWAREIIERLKDAGYELSVCIKPVGET